MRHAVATLVLLMACAVSGRSLADNIQASNTSTKILTKPDHAGDVWFAIKCTVTNNESTDTTAFVNLQGVDRNGFELKTVTLMTNLKAGQSRTITTKDFMPMRDFQVVTWHVKD